MFSNYGGYPQQQHQAGYGHGAPMQMPMPMPQISQRPPALPPRMPASSSRPSPPLPNVPPRRTSSAFPPPYLASPAPSALPSYSQSQSSSQYSSNSTGEIDKWMNDLIKSLLSFVQDAPRSDLQQLLDNEDKVNELVKDAEETKNLKRICGELAEMNKDLAVSNLALKPELQLLKNRLVAQGEEQNLLKSTYSSNQEKIGRTISLDTVLALLQAATSEVESESENISQEFMDKRKSIDEFVDQFVKRRTIYHLRKVKSEKMAELLRSGRGLHRSASSHSALNRIASSHSTQSMPTLPPGFGHGRPYP